MILIIKCHDLATLSKDIKSQWVDKRIPRQAPRSRDCQKTALKLVAWFATTPGLEALATTQDYNTGCRSLGGHISRGLSEFSLCEQVADC